ncbi:LuxR family transcriptional regulator, partial [Streptomyces sp. NPDC096068]
FLAADALRDRFAALGAAGTLFRRIQVLMARLGATSRFQMALQAQRSGWL